MPLASAERAQTVVVPPNTLVQDMARLVNSPDLADVKFIVEGTRRHSLSSVGFAFSYRSRSPSLTPWFQASRFRRTS